MLGTPTGPTKPTSPDPSPQEESDPSTSTSKPGADARYTRAFRRVERALLAETGPGSSVPADDAPFEHGEVKRTMNAARRIAAMARFTEEISLGHGFERAMVTTVRRLTSTGEWAAARSLALAVGDLPGGETAGRLGRVLAAHANLGDPLAVDQMSAVADADLAIHIPIEAVEACLIVGGPEARARAIAIARQVDKMRPMDAIGVAGRLLAMGEPEVARELAEQLRTRTGEAGLDPGELEELSTLERWLRPQPARVVPDGARPVGVIDYGQPDQSRASTNVGDYVQTLAMLGNLARLSEVEFSGEDGLGGLMTDLQASVKPELRLPGISGKVHLIELNRDFSQADSVPDETFTLAFGWHMHSLYGLRYEFPYHPNIRPLFVSFHVNRPEILTPEAIEYLRTYGPIGCRDRTTTDLLLSAGVDAFFSGCLTTTVDAVFPPTSEVEREADLVAIIDAPPGAGSNVTREVERVSHGARDVRLASLHDGVVSARQLLSRYQTHYRRIITGRLHSYLPATSLEIPVRFVPGNLADPRFDGLLDLTPQAPEFVAIRDTIRALLADVMGLVVSGASSDDVYARWRELTAPLVEQARSRLAERGDGPPATPNLDEHIAAIRAAMASFGPDSGAEDVERLDVALSLDQNLTEQLPVTLEALVGNSSSPLRLWITCRGLNASYQQRIADLFPDLPITFFPCDGITYGEEITRLIDHTTITTIDRLLLPELLPDVDRVTYVDIDALMLGDVAELARTDLDGHPLAARTSHRLATQVWHSAGALIPHERAFEFWHETSARHPFGYQTFNAGILVLDLQRMRSDRFSHTFLPWVGSYGLNDQDALLAYAGPDRKELAPRWNAWPVLEPLDSPAVVHYLGAGKPWGDTPTYAADLWADYQQRAAERAERATPNASARAPRMRSGRDVNVVLDQVVDQKLTYLKPEMLADLVWAVDDVETSGRPGAVIECGTALGGSAIVLASAKTDERPLKVYDLFGLIPPPSAADGDNVLQRYEDIKRGASEGIGGDVYYGYREDLLGEVTASFERLGVPIAEHAVELIQGNFADTLRVDYPVALAHLDGDWYESTMVCLREIWPNLVVGGRLILDDYFFWEGCRKAVDEYFADRSDFQFVTRQRLHVVKTGSATT